MILRSKLWLGHRQDREKNIPVTIQMIIVKLYLPVAGNCDVFAEEGNMSKKRKNNISTDLI